MRTPIGLVLLASGAILTFAVSAQVPGINLRIAGLILMATGLAEMVMASRLPAGLMRRLGGRAGSDGSGLPGAGQEPQDGDLEEAGYPAYLLQDPAVLAAEVLDTVSAARAAAGSAMTRPATVRAARRWAPEAGRQDEEG